jgi:hypothetical protein
MRKAEEEGLASLMNDTKWKELCFAFAAFEIKPAWRTRDLLNSYVSEWDSEWFHHVGPGYCSIEWLEIDPKGCDRNEIEAVLQKVGAPYEISDFFKVVGYRK